MMCTYILEICLRQSRDEIVVLQCEVLPFITKFDENETVLI